jgi:hypothetical protein
MTLCPVYNCHLHASPALSSLVNLNIKREHHAPPQHGFDTLNIERVTRSINIQTQLRIYQSHPFHTLTYNLPHIDPFNPSTETFITEQCQCPNHAVYGTYRAKRAAASSTRQKKRRRRNLKKKSMNTSVRRARKPRTPCLLASLRLCFLVYLLAQMIPCQLCF